jgi:BirA family biotin operon repressor/biotin-[acetyl-CoA-carboxylase] ligase
MEITYINYDRSHRLESVDSTNTYCKSDIVKFGDWVIAENQTKGRGRNDREWDSLGIGNIFFSTKVQCSVSILQTSPHLSLLVGGALLKTLKAVSKSPEELLLKWPNDIYKVNKKIAGILVESEIQGSSFNSIIGIGINLYNSKSTFPATSYGTLYETELEIGNKEKILQLLIENINITFQRLYVGEIKEEILWLESHSYLQGKNIQANLNGSLIRGKVIGFDKDGFLSIESDNQIISLMDTDPEFRIL